MSDTGSHHDAAPTPYWDDPPGDHHHGDHHDSDHRAIDHRDSDVERLIGEREAMEMLAAAGPAAAPSRVPPQPRPSPHPRTDSSSTFGDLVPWLPDSTTAPRAARRQTTRGPALGLTSAIVLTLLAAFFGWVSAPPFWLALGLGSDGAAVVTSCHRDIDSRCVGQFTPTDRSFTSDTVRLSGVPTAQRHQDAVVPARMLRENSEWAYAGSLGLRWKIGVLLALLCCVLVPVATGVRRLRSASRGARAALWTLGIAGPLVVTLGVMVATAL